MYLGRQATFVRIQRVVQLLSAEPAVCALPSPLGEEAAQPVLLLRMGSLLETSGNVWKLRFLGADRPCWVKMAVVLQTAV